MRTLILALLLTFPLPGLAQSIDTRAAENAVRDTIAQVKEIVKDKKGVLSESALDKEIEKVLLPRFDFELMARSSLGSGWRKANESEQREFVEVFTSLLSKSYLAKIRKNVENATVTLLPSTVKDDRVVVRSKVKTADQEVAIDYRIYLKDGQYRVYDVLVENVGLVSNYRSEFSSILDKSTFQELIARLKEKNEKL
jgi:phospholipid transport system substrate-binding protein